LGPTNPHDMVFKHGYVSNKRLLLMWDSSIMPMGFALTVDCPTILVHTHFVITVPAGVDE